MSPAFGLSITPEQATVSVRPCTTGPIDLGNHGRVLTRFHGYEFDDDRSRVDRDALWAFLSSEAYWARWRSRTEVETQLENAWRIVGVYDEPAGAMVGYARAVSDGVSFAYLADVYVHARARGNGLGKELVRVMIDAGPGADLRWTLHTEDAHGLYRQFGFAEPDATYLERPSRKPASADQSL